MKGMFSEIEHNLIQSKNCKNGQKHNLDITKFVRALLRCKIKVGIKGRIKMVMIRMC
jgi:hypothetical protein